MARLALGVVAAVTAACAPVAPASNPAPASPTSRPDSVTLIPPGMGSLRQDDVALHLQLQGLEVRAIPLEESILRTLSPDSYRSLRELLASQRSAIASVERRSGPRPLSLWYVSFFGTELGEVRFSPMEMIVTSVGQDFRPMEVVPLTPGFGSQRLRQRESQSALYVFDGQVDVNQPLVVQYETVRNTEWSSILERIERERALVRSRTRPKP